MDARTTQSSSEQAELRRFIDRDSFPCIMARAVTRRGLFTTHVTEEIESEEGLRDILSGIYRFVTEFRAAPNRLSSFTLVIKDRRCLDFTFFQNAFWRCLRKLRLMDQERFGHDPRVSDNPEHSDFSFSLGSEAFFILALHPQSPRWARRFRYPTIVFNPHVQFEHLRAKGSFKKVRDLIRLKDRLLQGAHNPMLSDFGEKSEVFQYLGIVYPADASVPLRF